MEGVAIRKTRRARRKRRVRKGVYGTMERPRLTVTRTLANIHAQIIDDARGVTVCAASTQNKDLRSKVSYGGNKQAAAEVGKALAERAKAAGISRVAFDRNGYKYHGRIRSLADAAREAGLEF